MAESQPTHSYHLCKDLTGQRFGRLYVLGDAGSTDRGKHSKRLWLCRCDCGTEVTVITNSLTSGNTRSCGCLYRETHRGNNHAKKHGLWKTPEWQAWSQMRMRCYQPGHISYPRYGGRGITVCERWRGPDTFPVFLADLGPRPPGHSLDRIDNDGPYCPENCLWATPAEQARNRRNTRLVTFQGVTLCLKDWAVKLGLTYHGLLYRFEQGMPLERALSASHLSKWDN